MIKHNVFVEYEPEGDELEDYFPLSLIIKDDNVIISSECKIIKVPMTVIDELYKILLKKKEVPNV